MIIVARSAKEAENTRGVIKALGYSFKCAMFWSEEWRKADKVIFLHKGYGNNGRPLSDWNDYEKERRIA